MDEKNYEEKEALLPKRHGNEKLGNRQTPEALMYKRRNGRARSGLPKEYGLWHTIRARLSRRASRGVLESVYEKLLIDRKITRAVPDSTGRAARQDSAGGGEKSIGKTKGGWNSKIHALAGSPRPPITLGLSAGNKNDVPEGRKVPEAAGNFLIA